MKAIVKTENTNSLELIGAENGTLFEHENKNTYPPEFAFVVINLLPYVPVYYDRNLKTWWMAMTDEDIFDFFSWDELYDYDGNESIYWQPIESKKI